MGYYFEGTPYEVRKVIKAWNLDFDQGNILKYLSRAGRKPGVPASKDYFKLIQYANQLYLEALADEGVVFEEDENSTPRVSDCEGCVCFECDGPDCWATGCDCEEPGPLGWGEDIPPGCPLHLPKHDIVKQWNTHGSGLPPDTPERIEEAQVLEKLVQTAIRAIPQDAPIRTSARLLSDRYDED